METFRFKKQVATIEEIEVTTATPVYYKFKDCQMEVYERIFLKGKHVMTDRIKTCDDWASLVLNHPHDRLPADAIEITSDEFCDKLGDVTTMLENVLTSIDMVQLFNKLPSQEDIEKTVSSILKG